MMIKESTYIGSYIREEKCPPPQFPEYAFIGRSNVGKSSLINMVTNKKDLAKVSGTPGKTQTINYFLMDKAWYLVDLPGLGYARISKDKREDWRKMIYYFLRTRPTLQYVFVLLDAMIPPQKSDMAFMNWLGENNIPFVVAYTKTDRVGTTKLPDNIKAIQDEILKTWDTLPREFITSAEKHIGRDEILDFILENNKNFGV